MPPKLLTEVDVGEEITAGGDPKILPRVGLAHCRHATSWSIGPLAAPRPPSWALPTRREAFSSPVVFGSPRFDERSTFFTRRRPLKFETERRC
jgi:hypothetical protein